MGENIWHFSVDMPSMHPAGVATTDLRPKLIIMESEKSSSRSMGCLASVLSPAADSSDNSATSSPNQSPDPRWTTSFQTHDEDGTEHGVHDTGDQLVKAVTNQFSARQNLTERPPVSKPPNVKTTEPLVIQQPETASPRQTKRRTSGKMEVDDSRKRTLSEILKDSAPSPSPVKEPHQSPLAEMLQGTHEPKHSNSESLKPPRSQSLRDVLSRSKSNGEQPPRTPVTPSTPSSASVSAGYGNQMEDGLKAALSRDTKESKDVKMDHTISNSHESSPKPTVSAHEGHSKQASGTKASALPVSGPIKKSGVLTTRAARIRKRRREDTSNADKDGDGKEAKKRGVVLMNGASSEGPRGKKTTITLSMKEYPPIKEESSGSPKRQVSPVHPSSILSAVKMDSLNSSSNSPLTLSSSSSEITTSPLEASKSATPLSKSTDKRSATSSPLEIMQDQPQDKAPPDGKTDGAKTADPPPPSRSRLKSASDIADRTDITAKEALPPRSSTTNHISLINSPPHGNTGDTQQSTRTPRPPSRSSTWLTTSSSVPPLSRDNSKQINERPTASPGTSRAYSITKVRRSKSPSDSPSPSPNTQRNPSGSESQPGPVSSKPSSNSSGANQPQTRSDRSHSLSGMSERGLRNRSSGSLEATGSSSPVMSTRNPSAQSPRVGHPGQNVADSSATFPASACARYPAFEHSIFNQAPLEDVVQQVADFLYKHINHRNVEIEAKLGRVMDNNTKLRLKLPVIAETVLSPHDESLRRNFKSDMSEREHSYFNKILNERVVETTPEVYKGSKVTYKHTREVDGFYLHRRPQQPPIRIRQTRDQATGEVIPGATINKRRVASLDVYNPRARLDYRISVNIEEQVSQIPPGAVKEYERAKDRLAYRHEFCRVDLTQVRSIEPRKGPHMPKKEDITHEVEVEFLHPEKTILVEREKLDKGQANSYFKMVQIFLNNVRILASRSSSA